MAHALAQRKAHFLAVLVSTATLGPDVKYVRLWFSNEEYEESAYFNTLNIYYLIKAPCSPNPCQNGGVCIDSNNSTTPYFACNCPNGYTGQNCEIGKWVEFLILQIRKLILNFWSYSWLLAPCYSNPCLNGATCSNNDNDTSPYYSCNCTNGYSGQNCQTRINNIGKNRNIFYILNLILYFKLLVRQVYVRIMAFA